MTKILLRIFIWLNNYSYKIISRLVVKENNGTHPKHDIMKYHSFFVNNIEKSDSVLDLGCGKGLLSFHVAKKAKEVVGVDNNKKSINWAISKYLQRNIVFIEGNILNLSMNKRYDKVILSNVLEHLDDRVCFLKNLRKVTGTILLRVPLITRDWLAVYKMKNNYNYKLDSTHQIEYDLDSLLQELSQANWELKSYQINFGELWGVCKNDS